MLIKNAKKVIGITALSAGLLFSSLPATTHAANTGDTAFQFNLNTASSKYTSARAKQNSTSTYVNINKVPAAYIYLDVQGFRPSGTAGANYWANETIGGTQTAPVGTWRVKQRVYENGGKSARLSIKRYMFDGSTSGVWSPDSVGSDPHLN